jgi:hypothetical protein
MSFGFGVGDFIAVGTLAKQVYDECSNAPADFKELAALCKEVHIAVRACRPNDAFRILRIQTGTSLAVLAADCHATLESLEALLSKYSKLNTVRSIGKHMGFAMAKE